jgi:hypothetical protein
MIVFNEVLRTKCIGGEEVERINIELVSKNSNGVFNTERVGKKDKEVPRLENCKLYHYGIGYLISEDITPKFQDWTFEDYLKEFEHTGHVRFIEPMSAFEDKEYINREGENFAEIAELKYDGHRGLLYIGDNYNRAFSRRVSKQTGWYTENSDQIPHIRDLMLPEFSGTVIDGEFDYGTTSMGAQSVMGAKPENAIQFQFENGWIQYNVFDILYYKGVNVQQMPLWKRKYYLYLVVDAFTRLYANCNINYAKMYMKPMVHEDFFERLIQYNVSAKIRDRIEEHISICDSYGDKFAEVIAEGKEGLMVKDLDMPYEQKRSKSFIKLKGMETWDCFMLGVTLPTKVYDGKEIETWQYWEIDEHRVKCNGQSTALEYANGKKCIAVTKPYYMGWIGAIQFAVHKPMTDDEYEELLNTGNDDQAFTDGSAFWDGDTPMWSVHVGDCKGLSEELLEDIKKNGEKYIAEKRVLEVLANGLINKETGTLRHPRFFRWNDAKSWKMCTWKDHIREV